MDVALYEQDYDYDTCYCIVGKERDGKSHLMLHLMDYLNAEVEDICLEGIDFIKRLYEVKERAKLALDEAGDSMFSRDAMTTQTKNFVKAFQAIGGKKLITFLILPSFFRLDKYFREDRVHSLFYVYQRGHYIYFDPKQLKRIQSQGFIKMPHQKSRFRNRFPKYTGRLLEPYNKLKKKKIQDILRKMQPEHIEEKKDKDKKLIQRMMKLSFTQKQIGEVFGVSRSAIAHRLRKKGSGEQ